MDGRKNNKGTKGNKGGRPPKADELAFIEKLDNIIDSDDAIKKLHTLINDNNFNALNVTSLKLNTAGTTNVNDIQNAKVFYTGSSSVFSSATQYGSTVAIPNGNFYVTGSRALSSGVNYFWVTYDVKSTATANNFIDARVDSIVIGGANSAPLNGNPTGARKILVSLSGNFNVGVGQTYVTITSAIDDIKSLGVSGPVVFTLKDALYNATSGEIFPIVFNNYFGSSATNTVTIRPDLGNISRVESSNATATFDLNGISNLIIDGRLGGTGTFVAGNNLNSPSITLYKPLPQTLKNAPCLLIFKVCKILLSNS